MVALWKIDGCAGTATDCLTLVSERLSSVGFILNYWVWQSAVGWSLAESRSDLTGIEAHTNKTCESEGQHQAVGAIRASEIEIRCITIVVVEGEMPR